MLAAMFSGRHPVAKDQDGRYFMDADGDLFAHILNYLRFETLPPANVSLDVYQYAVYFGIQSLVEKMELYEPVVHERYLEKIKSLYPTCKDYLLRIIDRLVNVTGARERTSMLKA